MEFDMSRKIWHRRWRAYERTKLAVMPLDDTDKVE
jgi:hypothetical protein